jgi:hypothetical protein
VPNGDWSVQQYSTAALMKMMPKPMTRAELVEKLGHTQKVERFLEKNPETVLKLPESPQLYYVKGWWDNLSVDKRTLQDYILSRRIQLQEYEQRVRRAATNQANAGSVAHAFRVIAKYYTNLADELEARFAEADEEESTD